MPEPPLQRPRLTFEVGGNSESPSPGLLDGDYSPSLAPQSPTLLQPLMSPCLRIWIWSWTYTPPQVTVNRVRLSSMLMNLSLTKSLWHRLLELPLLLVANLLLSLCRWIPTRLLSMKGWMLKTLSLIVVVLNSRKLCPLVPFEIDLLITDLLDPIAPASSSTAEAVPSAPQNDDLKEILDEALMVEDLDPEKNLSNWWEVKSG